MKAKFVQQYLLRPVFLSRVYFYSSIQLSVFNQVPQDSLYTMFVFPLTF